MKIISNLSIAIILIILISCQKEMMDTETNSDVPVVEAYLVPGINPEVKITKLLPITEDYMEPEPIPDLDVILAKSDHEYLLSEVSPGVYSVVNDSLLITSSEMYSLRFAYNSDTISASSIVPDKPDNFTISTTVINMERIEEGETGTPSFETIEITWNNPDESYHLIVIEHIESEPDLINANMSDMDLPTKTTSNPIVAPGYNMNMRSIYYFGTHRIILFKINQEYADLYESISQSSNSLANPLTNIKNGWGIFTGMNSDTLYLEVKEI